MQVGRSRSLSVCGRLTLGSIAICGLGCDSKLPAVEEGHRILGEVSYSGSAAAAMAHPVLQIAAFAEFPPKGPPRGSIVLTTPHAGSPVAYELTKVPQGSYKVVASIVDLDNATAPNGPSGAFPNLCAVIFSPVPNVTVMNDRANENVDITVYDRGADPCFAQGPTYDAGPADAGSVPDAPTVIPDASTIPDAARDAPISIPDARIPDAPASTPDADTSDAKADSGT